ncbi:AAA family ATPase [Bradyrhizobium sp.]|jgi:predicted ATPase/class 3 adenylate cyclase|uniref:AAA family ATPase n=1 Tax=Bradyrhizobium sp. TaxID=376 RepID=UPI003C230C82
MQAQDIGIWLQEVGLGQYRNLFSEQAIDRAVLPDLTDDDLSRLGMPLGHRKILFKAIDALLGREMTEPRAAKPVRPRPDAERRQVTVLICDMIGSTALASTLDPEELRKVMGLYISTCANVVTSLGGFVARYTGDGLVAYFGHPAGLEDAAERAVRAGLQLGQVVPTLAALPNLTLHVRTGIATGLVVVGDLLGEGAAREETVVGETPALAARLQSFAPPDGVAITDSTRRLIDGMFELESLGLCELKGVPGPNPVWRVKCEASAESRFDARHHTVLPDAIGRENELSLLIGRWDTACDGERQMLLLTGEAGIGKSRMCMALANRVTAEGHFSFLLQCSPFHTDSALHPIIAYLERMAGLTANMAPDKKLDRLIAEIQKCGNVAPETMALFATMLSIPTADRLPRHEMSPEQLKSLTLEALDDWLVNLSRLKPVLLILEDAHWIDPTTAEAITRSLGRREDARILTVITHRPDYHPPWTGPRVGSLNLINLSRRQSQELIRRVARRDLQDSVVEQILAKTDGVPLFIEELTKFIVESGTFGKSPDLLHDNRRSGEPMIPETLRDSLLARLDRLLQSKMVAQIGAAIGREFSYELLTAVIQCEPGELDAALAQLEAADLISARGRPPQAVYTFEHGLMQEAAYSTLLKSRRQTLHTRIAEVLQSQFSQVAEVQPELLAHHFSEAGLTTQAIDWWERAAMRSAQRSNNSEAVSQFNRALHLLGQVPVDASNHRREFEMRIALITPLYATDGYSGKEVEQNYDRLLELGQALGETRQLLRILWGQAGGEFVRCNFPRAYERVGSFIELAHRAGHRTSAAQGLRIKAMIAMTSGELIIARERYLQVMEEFEREGTAAALGDYLLIPRPTTLAQYAIAAQQLGSLDEAEALCERSLREARESEHPLTSCYAIFHCGLKAMVDQDHTTVLALAKEMDEIIKRHRVFYWEFHAELLLGLTTARIGELDEGLARLRRNAELRDRRERLFSPYFLINAAESLMQNQRNDEAIALLDRAEAEAEATGQHYSTAELFRVRACARQSQGAPLAEVEALFNQGLATAQRQSARLFELRTATGLAKVWRDAGRSHDARALLAPVYDWFTSGHNTVNLKEARNLLDSIS